MTRVLGIATRRVPARDLAGYLAEAAGRRAAAQERGLHYWVFEHARDPHRFIEFTEGSSDAAVTAFAGDQVELWRNIEHIGE